MLRARGGAAAPTDRHRAGRDKAWRALEFLLLFGGIPAAYAAGFNLHPLLLAGLVSVISMVLLLNDRSHAGSCLWHAAPCRAQMRNVLGLFAICGALAVAAVMTFIPQQLFALPRSLPWRWAGTMVLYPLFSVYPQEVIYRAFLFHRYRNLFGSGWPMILASAVAFALIHISFHNVFAVIATLIGGILFAWRYRATGSLLVVTLEHALYGCLMFSVGLHEYFVFRPTSSV